MHSLPDSTKYGRQRTMRWLRVATRWLHSVQVDLKCGREKKKKNKGRTENAIECEEKGINRIRLERYNLSRTSSDAFGVKFTDAMNKNNSKISTGYLA